MPDIVRDRPHDRLGALAAGLLGLAAFFIFCGPSVLLPTNIAWLDFADRAMHQLGWMFYREAAWGNPPGRSPDLGLELSNSIGLVDGLPLFAVPLKLVATWLPTPFQYWGYWLLISFLLQALFAYCIARELGAGRVLSLLAAAFVLTTPAFLFRIPMHLALSGHWVLLVALYLYIRRWPSGLWQWPLLLGLTAGIHAYLLAMVLGLWFAALLQRRLLGQLSWGRAGVELILGLVAAMIVLWLGGFFVTGTTGSYGYGGYKLNLLWPIIRYGWSAIFPDVPHAQYDYEGLSFLGIGILTLLALAILSGALVQLRAIAARRWWPLAIMLVAMMLFAVTTSVQLGGIALIELPLPQPIIDLFSTFRSTGRFVWPLLYIVTIGTVVLVARHFPLRVAASIALVAFFAQAVDSAPAWSAFPRSLLPPSDRWQTSLTSPFWERAAASGITRIRAIPVRSMGRDWKALGYFAITHGMATDSVYLGRVDDAALAALRERAAQALATGAFEQGTIYVLDLPSALRAARFYRPGDLLAVIDGRFVFVRGGATMVDGLGISPRLGWSSFA